VDRPGSAQRDWDEQPEIRPTEAVVGADLLHGPHYALGPTVTTFAYLNRYTVTSDLALSSRPATQDCGG
jgi:hypothetical protein